MATIPYSDREVTRPPDWHGLVVWDFLFNAGTTGLFLVAAVADLLRPDLFAPAARWAYPVALVLLSVDLVLLVLDLGHPARFHHMLRVFKPSSPMSLGTWCLTAYSAPLAVAAAASLFGWDEVRRLAAGLGLLPAVGSVLYKGVLFSTSAQPGWRDARWLGAYHTASAVALGAAGLLTLCGPDAAEKLRPAVAVLVVFGGVALELLLVELTPALARRYPAWVTTAVGLPATLAALPVGLLLVGRWPADAVAFALLVGSAWAVRAVLVRLPQKPH